MKYGSILQACRERAGLSQEQLALKLNRSRSCISKLEHDLKSLDVPTLVSWAKETGTQEVIVAFICGMDGLTIMQSILDTVVGGVMITLWLM